ncbi:MAG TPA: hypothetical protein VH021_25710 [Trebonia sp.]|nr:hypothetical protein [Trebonia sp.]
MRRAGRWLIALAAAGQVIALAGCGGGGASPSAAQYRKSLDALCASAAAFNRSLPHLQQSQHLSVDELAVDAGKEFASFRSSVSRLTPPAGLSRAHDALVAELDRQPTSSTPLPNTAASFAGLEKHSQALLSDYTALGASGCEADARQAIAAVQADEAAAAKP